MKRILKKINQISLLILFCICFLIMPIRAEETIYATMVLDEVNEFGNIIIRIEDRRLTYHDLETYGIEYGDIVKFTFSDNEIYIPIVQSYSDGQSGLAILKASEDKVVLALNAGDFASMYIADKHEDNGVISWTYKEGIETPIIFEITLDNKGGYYEEYGNLGLIYSTNRDDFLHLNDEQFANFRSVDTTGMGKNILYRSASPINPKKGRNQYVDEALRKANVQTCINLADNELTMKEFEGYPTSYYSQTNTIGLKMGLSYHSDNFKEKLREGLLFMCKNPGPYDIFCVEGKDRTGFVIALLECYMGASYEEIIDDYMETFDNYYGINQSDERYEDLAKNNIITSLETAFEVNDLKACNLKEEATEFFQSIGLNHQDLETLHYYLSGYNYMSYIHILGWISIMAAALFVGVLGYSKFVK